MAQPPFLTDSIQIEPSSGQVLRIERNSVDGSLLFVDPQVTAALRLKDLAGIRNLSGVFTVGAGDGAQYPKIQQGIDAAPASSSATNPSLIVVGPGTYTENILIQKDGIFIVGMGGVCLQPAVAAPTILIEAGTTTTPERVHLEGMTIAQPHHGKDCLLIQGGAGSRVGLVEISSVNCDLEATGVGAFHVRSETANRVRIVGGTWKTSSSTSLLRVNETAQFVLRDVDEIRALQLDYNTSGPLPALTGSAYRIQNIGVIGNLQSELVGDGELHLSGSPDVGDVTILGDQVSEITGSRVQDLLANGSSTVRIVGTSFDTYGGTGTVLEWDGLQFATPSAGGGGGTDTIPLTASSNIDLGDAIALDPGGGALPATALSASNVWSVMGVATSAASAGNIVVVYVGRALTACKFTVAPGAANNGQEVFLDTFAGEVTLTPPTSSGNVIVKVGILQGADGIALTPDVLFLPEVIASIP